MKNTMENIVIMKYWVSIHNINITEDALMYKYYFNVVAGGHRVILNYYKVFGSVRIRCFDLIPCFEWEF